jgi:hypothetical protein
MFEGYPVGIKVDILDDNHDVYSPAIIVRNNLTAIDVSYVGWGKEWDETVTDPARVSFNSTKYVKAWVRLNHGICMWPCVLYLRMPKAGSIKGEEYLKTESRVLTSLCGPYSTCPFKSLVKPNGTWVSANYVFPFGTTEDKKRIKTGKKHKFGAYFNSALDILTKDPESRIHQFVLAGSLDISSQVACGAAVSNHNGVKQAVRVTADKSVRRVCGGIKVSFDDRRGNRPPGVGASITAVSTPSRPTYVLSLGDQEFDITDTNQDDSHGHGELHMSAATYVEMVHRANSVPLPLINSKKPFLWPSMVANNEPKLPSVAALNSVVSCIGNDYDVAGSQSKLKRCSLGKQVCRGPARKWVVPSHEIMANEKYSSACGRACCGDIGGQTDFDATQYSAQVTGLCNWHVLDCGLSSSNLVKAMRIEKPINDEPWRKRKRFLSSLHRASLALKQQVPKPPIISPSMLDLSPEKCLTPCKAGKQRPPTDILQLGIGSCSGPVTRLKNGLITIGSTGKLKLECSPATTDDAYCQNKRRRTASP